MLHVGCALRMQPNHVRLCEHVQNRNGSRYVPVQRFDEDSDHPAERGANRHRRNENARGDLATVRDHDETSPQEGREQERIDHSPLSPCPAPIASIAEAELIGQIYGRHLLAEVFVVSSSFAFAEQNIEHFVHIDPQELVQESDGGGQSRKNDGFRDSGGTKVLATKCRDLEVVLDHECSVQALRSKEDTRQHRKTQILEESSRVSVRRKLR